MSFLKLFLGRCKMQFWQPLRKFFQKKAQRLFAQNPKMIKKKQKYIHSSKKCFSSNFSNEQVENRFDNPSQNFSKKGRNVIAQAPQRLRET